LYIDIEKRKTSVNIQVMMDFLWHVALENKVISKPCF